MSSESKIPQQLYEQLFAQEKYYEAQQIFMTQVTRKNSVELALSAVVAFLGCDSENKIELAASMGSYMIEIAQKRIAGIESGEVADEDAPIDISTGSAEADNSLESRMEDLVMESASQSLVLIIEACERFPETALKSSTNAKVFFNQAVEFSIKYSSTNSPHGHPAIHAQLAKQLDNAGLYPEAQRSWAVAQLYHDHIEAARKAIVELKAKEDANTEAMEDDIQDVNTDVATVNEPTRLIISAVLNYLAVEDLNGGNRFFDALGSEATPTAQSFLRCALALAEKEGAAAGKQWKRLLSVFTNSLLTEVTDAKTEKKKWKLEEIASAVGVALWAIAPPKGMLDSILDATSMFQGLDIGSLLKGMGGMGMRQ